MRYLTTLCDTGDVCAKETVAQCEKSMIDLQIVNICVQNTKVKYSKIMNKN